VEAVSIRGFVPKTHKKEQGNAYFQSLRWWTAN
jgi:hypothetical protein